MKRMVKLVWISTVSLLLGACTYNPFVADNKTTGSLAGTAIGAGAGAGGVALLGGSKSLMVLGGLGGGMFGYYVTTLRHDSGAIIQASGQVYQVGDFIGIYIPSDKLFEPNTDEFLPQAFPILDSAVTVLKRYPNQNIMISGNTSGFYRARWEQRLSEKRAQKIAAYFWNQGINEFKDKNNNMRRLNYVGYGDYFPIANTYTNNGIRENSRIQIVSYPTICHLQLDKKSMAMNNVGSSENDGPINQAPARCCPSEDRC